MSEKPNFHKLHEERNALRHLDQEGELASPVEQEVKKSTEEAHTAFRINDFGTLSNAKRELRFQKQQFEEGLVIDWQTIREALGTHDAQTLDIVEAKADALTNLIASQSKKLREMNGNPKKTELYKALVRAIGEDVKTKEAEFDTLAKEHPALFRIKDLLAYREGLFEDGHIAEVPSVKKYLAKIEEAMIEGKPMFLHGPTGTGKTSLAIRTARKLSGKDPEIIYCNPQTKESNVFGKTGIGIDEKTEKQITQFDYGPLVRAMQEGKTVIFDEFTALPKDMMVMLKGIMSGKVGDRRTVTGDGEVTIAPGFQMIFTANLKSEKNQERQDIPPEMANEFAQNNLEVTYQATHESYDILLARLLHPDGTITMSEYDMEVTLPKLCEAIAEIQRAYTDNVESDVGGKEGLKKLVFNQRTVENILARWNTREVKVEEGDFVTFLDEQLAIPLTFREYSEKDRVLTAKILARHGLLTTLNPEALGLPSDTFSFNPTERGDSVRKSSAIKHYALTEVAKLDPFGQRGAREREEVDALIEEITPERSHDTPDALQKLLKDLGSPATPDTSFEGGIVSFDIPPATVEALKSFNTAKEAYEATDGGSWSYIWDGLKDYPWKPLSNTTLDVLVLNHGETTPRERDTLVTHMDTLGYRPLTLAELMALGITRPDLNKRTEYLNTCEKHVLGGISSSPYLCWDGSRRGLNADYAVNVWYDRNRFPFVRK